MKNKFAITFVSMLLGAPVFADGHAMGNAESGEELFKKCRSCHMVKADDGEVIFKGGKTGPNLYGVYGRVPGTTNFRYGKSLKSFAENSAMPEGWNEEDFVEWLMDPRGWLREKLDDKKAKSKMSFRLKDEQQARDIWAYLVSVGPEPEADASGEEGGEAQTQEGASDS